VTRGDRALGVLACGVGLHAGLGDRLLGVVLDLGGALLGQLPGLFGMLPRPICVVAQIKEFFGRLPGLFGGFFGTLAALDSPGRRLPDLLGRLRRSAKTSTRRVRCLHAWRPRADGPSPPWWNAVCVFPSESTDLVE
jgi:hypothetical protein